MRERWMDGFYVGKVWETDEDQVPMQDGTVVRTHAIIARLEGINPTKEELERIMIRPGQLTGTITLEETRRHEDLRPEEEPPLAPKSIPRSFPITKVILDALGYTLDCPRCEAIMRGATIRTVHHNQVCRQRLEKAMKDDPRYKRIVEEAEERKREYLGRDLEEHLEGEERRKRAKVEEKNSEPNAPGGGIVVKMKLGRKTRSDANGIGKMTMN